MRKDKKYIQMSRLCVLLIFIATIIGSLSEVLIVYLSVIIHEGAHLFACKRLGVPTSYIAIYPYGMELKLQRLTTPSEQIKISAAGPVSNLILFMAGYGLIFLGVKHHLLSFFTSANFILMIFNLLPCSPLDGGEILRNIMSAKYGILNSYKILVKTARIFNILFFITGAVLFYLRLNISLLIISLLVYKSIQKQRNCAIYASKEILLGKVVSQKKEKRIVFSPDINLRKIVNFISFDYTLYAVFEKEGKTYGICQEDILKNVKKNPSISLMDCVENYKIL